jgi:hypothetical protein
VSPRRRTNRSAMSCIRASDEVGYCKFAALPIRASLVLCAPDVCNYFG